MKRVRARKLHMWEEKEGIHWLKLKGLQKIEKNKRNLLTKTMK